MDNLTAFRTIAKAHIYGYFRDEPIPTSNLFAVVHCNTPGVLTQEGYLHGDAVVRALTAYLEAKRSQGMHGYPLCDDYYVTYIDADGLPLRRDRWISIDPNGWPAKNTEASHLAKVSASQVYRQAEQLAGMSHVIHA